MMENEDEYWAEGCQSWFDATVREDVNDGINTREKLQQHDPALAAALAEAFGANSWRYHHDAPGKLEARSSSSSNRGERQQQQQQDKLHDAPAAEAMDRMMRGASSRGCLPAAAGAARCVGGCWAASHYYWAGLVRRAHRGAAAAVKMR
jgi:hypothetical protein